MVFAKCWDGEGKVTMEIVICFTEDNLPGKVTVIRNLFQKEGF